MADDKRKASPDVCSYVNEENDTLHLEVSLPGVRKEDISLKLNGQTSPRHISTLLLPRKDTRYSRHNGLDANARKIFLLQWYLRNKNSLNRFKFYFICRGYFFSSR